jgi:hypothetical protein
MATERNMTNVGGRMCTVNEVRQIAGIEKRFQDYLERIGAAGTLGTQCGLSFIDRAYQAGYLAGQAEERASHVNGALSAQKL